MTIRATFLVDNTAAFVKRNQVTLSGVVDDGTNPVSREIIVYAYPEMNKPIHTQSDATDGTWSVILNLGPANRILVIAVGATSGENSVIFDHIEE